MHACVFYMCFCMSMFMHSCLCPTQELCALPGAQEAGLPTPFRLLQRHKKEHLYDDSAKGKVVDFVKTVAADRARKTARNAALRAACAQRGKGKVVLPGCRGGRSKRTLQRSARARRARSYIASCLRV